MNKKKTLKKQYGKSAEELAVTFRCSSSKIRYLHKSGKLAKAIETNTVVCNRYQDIYGATLPELAVELGVGDGIISAMHKHGVLKLARENARILKAANE